MTRIRFEDLPSTNTPRNAENLNKLNNVVISSTEPNTGEEVWLQKGKNLLSNNITYGILIGTDGTSSSNGNWNLYNDYVKVGGNEDLTFSASASTQWRLYEYDQNKQWLQRQEGTGSSQHFVTSNNTRYVRFGVFASASNPMAEFGSTATTYEAYIDKKIYVKNTNGNYEKFYNESEINKETYSTEETRIGTWIDGKPIYRKVVNFGTLPNNTTKTVEHLISNLNQVIKIEIISKNPNSNAIIPIPYFDGTNRASVYISSSGIVITTNTNVWSNNQTYVIIEYTKTTD